MKEATKQILIVDDNDMNRKLTTMFLRKLEYESLAAASGAEALEMVREEAFGLILMDYRMPEMDGIETAIRIRNMEGAYFKKVPIIALTGDEREEVHQAFWDAGMNDILFKPLDSKKLEALLKRWLLDKNQEECPDNNSTELVPGPDIEEMQEQDEVSEWSEEELAQLQRAGISIGEGIKNCGGVPLFCSLLADFYHLIDFKAEKLQKYLAQECIKEYTIEVHALKNSARLIGALALSEEFAEQEKLGNQEELCQLQEKAPVLLEHMGSCKEALVILMEKNIREEKRVSLAELKEVLLAMRDAADTFDIDGMDAAMRELETYCWPEQCSGYKERLKAYVADVALQDILNEITEIVHILEKTE